MNRCIVYKRSFKLFHFTLVTPWQCKYAFGVCLMILENESAGIKCNGCGGGSLMWLLDLSKASVIFPPFLCSPHHKDKALAAFSPNTEYSQVLAWIRQSWNIVFITPDRSISQNCEITSLSCRTPVWSRSRMKVSHWELPVVSMDVLVIGEGWPLFHRGRKGERLNYKFVITKDEHLSELPRLEAPHSPCRQGKRTGSSKLCLVPPTLAVLSGGAWLIT